MILSGGSGGGQFLLVVKVVRQAQVPFRRQVPGTGKRLVDGDGCAWVNVGAHPDVPTRRAVLRELYRVKHRCAGGLGGKLVAAILSQISVCCKPYPVRLALGSFGFGARISGVRIVRLAAAATEPPNRRDAS